MIKSAAIVDKDGTIYVARQYCKMTKAKVEALYRTFSRLLTKDAQHTMIYSNEYRYIYRLVNEFYCVLVTDRDSNIIDDTKTLGLFTNAIIHYASVGKGVTLDGVEDARFDLLFAFDEIVNMGFRQVDDMTQLLTIMNMESEEEKAAQEALLKKEREAKTRAAEKSKELDQKRKNEMLAQMERASMGGRGGFGISSTTSISSVSLLPDPIAEPVESKPPEPARVRSKGRALKLGKSSRS